ncbi:MAG: 3,4-dihydroxy-2-butanone-4-phosphate synthase [Nannocystis sp.]|uniref:3,4-dihydroxy-2-butanone-4-phosphate synthase n=1 Tax=Nannocystis sp. TaxID=1962667 RepID=UPI0024222E59|nr:3,4-dihydroxy-2-butanone-4-phosphate synthase [Nannocystis sp.]MBK9754864.1 3,4-dihydroxy-2-butanone-4-phosphate synthase [Nannocystis sp.]
MSEHNFDHVERCIEVIRRGGMIILVDDKDRENEGDLVIGAQACTPEHVNFMCREGRGLICLALTPERVAELRLPMMVPTDPGHMGTAFTVSIEARRGVTTGISAADRAQTIRVASDDTFGAADIVSPGHIFPLRAQPGGVLVRSGHTEGSVDLARLAGLRPAAVICEIMRDDGEMARMDDLERFAQRHDLPILSIADLIGYRLQRELLVEEFASAPFVSPLLGLRASDGWTIRSYRSKVQPHSFYVALCKGDLQQSQDGDDSVLLRAQRAQLLGDVFGLADDDSASRMRASIRQIERAGRGVFLYVLGHRWPPEPLLQAPTTVAAPSLKPAEAGFREFGLGAQVLRSLGIHRIRVLTNHPRKIVGLSGFGIETVGALAFEEDASG